MLAEPVAVPSRRLDAGALPSPSWRPVGFHLVGLAVLGGLLACAPLDAVAASLRDAGPRVLPVFALAVAWIAADAAAVACLVGGRVPWKRLFHQQVVADAIGQAVPLMGLAGEPWRARELGTLLPAQEACGAVVTLRVVHAASGALHAGWTLAVVLLLAPFPAPWPRILGTAAVVSTMAGLLLVAGSLTVLPARMAAALVRWLGLPAPGAMASLGRGRVLGALACKMAGRTLQMLEIAAGMALLGETPTPVRVLAVAAFIALGATAFFMVPQGLGVSEVGVTTAMVLLGLPASVGIALALMRRARIVAWMMGGLALAVVTGAGEVSSCWRRAPRPTLRRNP